MTLEEQLAEQARKGLLGLGLEEETAEEYAPWASLLAQFIPGVGEGVGIDNTVDAINDERYGDAAIEGGLTLLGAVPVVGDVAAAAIKGIRKAPVKAFDEAAWLKANPRPEGPISESNKDYVNWRARKNHAKSSAARNDRRREIRASLSPEERARRDARQQELVDANKEENLRRRRERAAEVSDQKNERERARYANESPEKRAERVRKQRERRQKNIEAAREYDAGWRDRNRGKVNSYGSKRRAAEMQRTPVWADPDRIEEIYKTAADVSAETGIPHHVDHVMPLQGKNVSGLHHQDNLLIVPGAENLSKGNRFEPGDLPPRAGVRKSRAYLKKIKAAQEAAKRK